MSSRRRHRGAAPRPTVVFDIGGVLSAGHDPVPALHELLGGDIESLRAALWTYRAEYDLGQLSASGYWTAVAASVGIEHLTEAEVEELQGVDSRYFLQLDPEARALLHDLARNSVRIALLSNASVPFAQALRAAEWFEVVSLAVVSGEEGVMKPDPEIFEILLDVLAHETGGVSRPESVIFFDDRPANVEAAKRLRIDAHLWPRNGGYDGADGEADPSVEADPSTEADPSVEADPSNETPRSGAQIAREVLRARQVPLD